MSRLQPLVASPAGPADLSPAGVRTRCLGRTWERSRFEWRHADGGDPVELIEKYLAEHGLPVDDLGRLGGARPGHVPGQVCGAAVLFGGAVEAGPANPAPAVPDVVGVVYEHRDVVAPPAGAVAGTRVGPWRPSWSED